eukprot:gene6135-925_t
MARQAAHAALEAHRAARCSDAQQSTNTLSAMLAAAAHRLVLELTAETLNN